MNKFKYLLLMLILALSVAACDGGDDMEGDGMEMEDEESTAPLVDEDMAQDDMDSDVVEAEDDMMMLRPVSFARASDILGTSVILNDGEMTNVEAGEVRELLMNENGEIAYVLFGYDNSVINIDFGGDTMAVPWDQFNIVVTEDAEGTFFDYGVEYLGTVDALGGMPAIVLEDFDASIFDTEMVTDDNALSQSGQSFLRASGLTDMNLINLNDEDLGEVEDFIVNTEEGVAEYAIADFGGFLGIGETATAVPWGAFAIDFADEDFVLNIEDGAIADAPDIDFDLFDNATVDPNWNEEVDIYWEPFMSMS